MGLQKERKKRRDPDMATKESTIDKGGFVENVANVSPEPDEKKVRGQPFTYAELGGVLAQDVEDRKGFASGDEVLGQEDMLGLMQRALDQHQPTEPTPEDIRMEEHWERVGAEDQGLRESAPLINTAAALYGLPRAAFGATRSWYQKQHLNPTLWHGGPEGLSTIKAGKAIVDDPRFAKFKMSEGQQRYQQPVIYAGEQAHTGKRYAKFFEEATERGGAIYKLKGTFPEGTSIQLGGKVFGRPPKALMTDLNAQIDKTIGRLYRIKKESNIVPIEHLSRVRTNVASDVNEFIYSEKLSSLLDLKHMLRGNFSKVKGQPQLKSEGIPTTLNETQYNFLKTYDIRRLRGKLVFQGLKPDRKSVVLDQDSIEIIKKLPLGKSEGGLVGELDRLGFDKGGWLSKRRAARQHDIYEKGYSRFMNWAVDQFTPFGRLGNISNLDIDPDKRPRLYNLVTQAGKLYDTAGGAAKSALTFRKGESRYDERGLLKDPASYETNYDELITQMQALNPSFEKGDTRGLFGGIGREGRKDRRKVRKAEREEEGGWFKRLMANIKEREGGKRGAGEIADRTSSVSMLAPLAARAGPQNPTRTVDDYGQVTFGSRGQEEAEQNIREAKAAHRRVSYAAGGTADLDILLDDLKTTYDSLSPEEESELQSLIGGREGFDKGGDAEWTPEDEEEEFRRILEWRSKNIPTKESAKKEYYRRRDDLEDYISKNRLVSKEAQMSLLSGEGYRDLRFIATTGDPLIDKHGLHPFAPEGSGQVLSAKEMNVKGPTKDWNITDIREDKSLVDQIAAGAYNPDTDKIQWRTDPFDINPDKNAIETQIHELIHRTDNRSGYNNVRMQRLNKKFPDGNLFLAYAKVSPKWGERIFLETLAHSLEHKLSGGKLSDKKLKDVIKLRMTNLLPEMKKESTLDKYSDTLNKMIPIIIEDFESYLQELEE